MTDGTAARIARRVDAAIARGAVARSLTIARAGIDIRAEEQIASVLAPFDHLQSTASRETALTIHVAAMRDGDVPELAHLSDAGAVVSEGDVVVHLHHDAAAVFDRAAATIHVLMRHDGGAASWVRAKPLQLPLSIFFAGRGVDLIHGALVSRRGNGVLIAGNGGAGKSTLSIAAVLAGLDFLGDDCVATEGLTGYSVFGSGCLAREHLAHFSAAVASRGAHEEGGSAARDDKDVLLVAEIFPRQMAASTAIRGIVLPRVTHAEHATLHRASGREALLALAPGSILKRAVPAAHTMARMAQLAREVPAFRLEMGPIADAGARLAELIEELTP